MVITYVLAWAVATLVLAGFAPWAWGLLALAILVRGAMAITVAKFVLDDREVLRDFWLLPVRDFVALVIWLAGCVGRRIVWRGEIFHLKQGRLVKAAEAEERPS